MLSIFIQHADGTVLAKGSVHADGMAEHTQHTPALEILVSPSKKVQPLSLQKF